MKVLTAPHTWIVISSITALVGIAAIVLGTAIDLELFRVFGVILISPHILIGIGLGVVFVPLLLLRQFQQGSQSPEDATKRTMVEPIFALMGPAPKGGAMRWPLPFATGAEQALARKIAEAMYGDAGKSFQLLLYRIDSDEKGTVEFELEVAPAPTNSDLTFTIVFPGEQTRQFALEVPPELRRDPNAPPRLAVRSDPCEPLQTGAEGSKLTWSDVMPPRIIFEKQV